jgi:hypothetical protein
VLESRAAMIAGIAQSSITRSRQCAQCLGREPDLGERPAADISILRRDIDAAAWSLLGRPPTTSGPKVPNGPSSNSTAPRHRPDTATFTASRETMVTANPTRVRAKTVTSNMRARPPNS